MTSRIGIDIEDLKEFKQSCKDKNFLNLIFTNDEITDLNKNNSETILFAQLFSAKEAVAKVLPGKVNLKDIEIQNILESPRICYKQKKMNRIMCSVSLTTSHVIALAVSIR